MAATTLSKSVSLRIVANSGTAKATLDDIATKADDIDGKKSTLTVKIDDGTTKADLDEITAKADALGIKKITFKVAANTAGVKADLAETKLEADSLGKSFLGAASSITGFSAAQDAASSDGNKFKLALAGLNLATGVLEPVMAGAVVAVGGLAAGLASAGVGLGVFGLIAKTVYSQASTAATAYATAQQQLNSATTSAQRVAALQAEKAAMAGLSPPVQSLAMELGNLKNMWQNFTNAAAPGVVGVLSQGIGILTDHFGLLNQFLPPVEAALSHVMGDLNTGLSSGGFKSFLSMLAQNTGPAIEKIATAIGHVVVGIGGILKAFMPVSQGMLSGLDSITAKFEKWGETLSSHSGFQSLMTMFKTETPMAMQTLGNLAKIIDGVVKSMTGLDGIGNSKTLLEILTPLTGLLAKLANGNPILDRTVLYLLATADAGKKLKNVFTSLQSGVGVLKDIGSGMQDFNAGFSNTEAAANDATGVLGTLGGKVSGLGSFFQTAALKMGLLRTATVEGTEAQEGLDVAMEANPIGLIVVAIGVLVAAFVVLWLKCAAFRDFWKDAWKDIQVAFSDVFDFIKNNWQLIVGILTLPIGGAVLLIIKYWKQIQTGFQDAWNGIKSFFSSIWSGIESSVKTGIANVVSFFAGLPGKIGNALSSLASLLGTIGYNMIVGLWNGMVSMMNWVLNQVENFANNIINTFSSILHIFSPSRVFHQFGQYIVLGLVNGIRETQGMAVGAVTDLAHAVSGSFNPSFPAAGRGGVSQAGSTIQANITVTGVVGDAGATGRQIAVALNEYLRQTGQAQIVGV